MLLVNFALIYILSVFPKYFTYSAILRKVCAGKWGLNAFHFVVSGLFGFSITEDSWHLIVDLHAIFCFGNHDHARILCGSQNSGGAVLLSNCKLSS